MTSAAAQPTVVLDGPPDPELVRIRDLVYREAGIFHPDNKLRLLFDRCSHRMKATSTPTLRGYLERLTAPATQQAELVELLNEITIGETSFFRNQPQLEALRLVVLPRILEQKSKTPFRQLHLWSAGCSTGEEPYTISMLLLEEAQDRLKDWSVRILATDLNERSLAHAENAAYGTYSTRHVTPRYRQKYFAPAGEDLRVQPVVRSRVTFQRLNLSDENRMALMKGVDVIFCCNVLIYFDLESKRKVLRHFYNNLSPYGYLFLGHSESLYGVSDDFRLVHLPGATAYVKGEHVPEGGNAQ